MFCRWFRPELWALRTVGRAEQRKGSASAGAHLARASAAVSGVTDGPEAESCVLMKRGVKGERQRRGSILVRQSRTDRNTSQY